GSMGTPPCHSTPGTAASPSPAPLEHSSPQNQAVEPEPVGLVAAATTVPSPEPSPGAVSWMMPLVWLERTLPDSSLLESLRHSLPLSVSWRDAGTSVTRVPTATMGTSVTPIATVSAGTSVTPVVTPVATAAIGTSVTPVATTSAGTAMTPQDSSTATSVPARAKDSAAETDSLLWHCPREQLRSLPRAELEGRLESTLIIIEALSLQLRGWQESQRPLPSVGPAAQRDAHTQTDVTRPQGEEGIYHGLYVELWKKSQALQRQRAAEQELARELARALEVKASLEAEAQPFHEFIAVTLRNLQEERGALDREREQVRVLVSRCRAMLRDVPNKLQGCLQERDAAQQRADE
ncbi:SPAG5 protein, partial [Penelope pileata]|nr:SPAG5 protein [Penelope pileata]